MSLCMVFAMLAGCASSDTESNATVAPTPEAASTTTDVKTVTIAQSADPQTLDPHKVGGDIAAIVWRNICQPLFFYDSDWIPYCELAESYEQISDVEWSNVR